MIKKRAKENGLSEFEGPEFLDLIKLGEMYNYGFKIQLESAAVKAVYSCIVRHKMQPMRLDLHPSLNEKV